MLATCGDVFDWFAVVWIKQYMYILYAIIYWMKTSMEIVASVAPKRRRSIWELYMVAITLSLSTFSDCTIVCCCFRRSLKLLKKKSPHLNWFGMFLSLSPSHDTHTNNNKAKRENAVKYNNNHYHHLSKSRSNRHANWRVRVCVWVRSAAFVQSFGWLHVCNNIVNSNDRVNICIHIHWILKMSRRISPVYSHLNLHAFMHVLIRMRGFFFVGIVMPI